MEKSILIGGFGGQGVQTLGKLLIYAANDSGKQVTFYPAYGAEMRGGTSNCTVVISDEEIGAPSRGMLDCVVAMNGPSFNKFKTQVKDGGMLLVNSSLVKEEFDKANINVVRIPLNDIAETLGSSKTLNIIMLGFFIAFTGIIPLEAGLNVLAGFTDDEVLSAQNFKAYNAGADYAKSLA